MNLQITGKVIEVLGIVGGTSANGKEWKKQDFIIETVEQYSKKVYFTLFGEQKINSFGSALAVGNMVDVSFDVSSREWTGKDGKRSFFTSCNAYSVVPSTAMAVPQQQAVAQTNPSQPSAFEQAQMVYSNPVPSNPPAPQDPFANQGADTTDLPF